MKASIRNKLEQAEARLDEVGALLADPEVLAQPDRYRQLSVEYAQLSPLVECYHNYESTREALEQAREMMADGDDEMRALAEDEVEQAEERLAALEQEVKAHLLPADPYDNNNLFLEVRAGTGGHEAALFAGDLLRMYTRYAERRGWTLTVLSESPGEHGGYKEVIARVDGRGAYARLKFESGVHRVQRVPETESQGRIHTSACTVAVLPEVPEVEAEAINTNDLRIDTFRSSGAGGQHVNKTDSAIRITHLPSGIVVECQEERSQHKNRARALAFLQAKLLDRERRRRDAERAEERRSQVGSGDRSERIRTYNFPQGRVTDHRINLTLHQLESILEGDLDPVTSALRDEAHMQQLAALGE